jgi:hypothetical protein
MLERKLQLRVDLTHCTQSLKCPLHKFAHARPTKLVPLLSHLLAHVPSHPCQLSCPLTHERTHARAQARARSPTHPLTPQVEALLYPVYNALLQVLMPNAEYVVRIRYGR